MNERVAIVTGGTGALGRFIVNKFADEGITVYVPARTIEEFNKIFDSSAEKESEYFRLRKIYCFQCDATDENSVNEFVDNVVAQENDKLDFLINTVGGISPSSKAADLSTEILDQMINLNFKSAFFFTREALRSMRKNNYGRIISLGAIAGLEPSPGRFAYSFSKAGVINLIDTISEEFKDMDIRCNTIIPGIIDTPANREWGSPEEIKKWVKPEQIAEIIYNFVSDEFSEIRSSHIKVYGSY
ncbi:MAG: SDR family NAD(P)-dependent oxidoreductase [Ignavibacteria bacterium]|nr:SDR family NAD(P)-dependent oxidoreductase [Ignavibacteria bacterium]